MLGAHGDFTIQRPIDASALRIVNLFAAGAAQKHQPIGSPCMEGALTAFERLKVIALPKRGSRVTQIQQTNS
jgi:hypothetical protein